MNISVGERVNSILSVELFVFSVHKAHGLFWAEMEQLWFADTWAYNLKLLGLIIFGFVSCS